MSQVQYNSALPDNNKSSYNPLDVVSFTLNSQNRALVGGSVRLNGKLRVNSVNNTRVNTEDVRFNKNAGVANFIEGVQVSTAQQGSLETQSFDYSRLINMMAVGTKDMDDSISSHDLVELKAPISEFTQEYCRGENSKNSGAKVVDDYSFSHKLKVCLNKVVSENSLISFDKTGFIKIQISLNRNNNALFGSFYTDGTNNISTSNFTLSDLEISYQTVDSKMANNSPVEMRTVIPIKSILESDFSNIQASVPQPCDAVTISYQELVRESQQLDAGGHAQIWDNQALNNLPDWKSIQFIFQNSQSNLVSYIIDSESEALKRGLESLADTGHSQLQQTALESNDKFLHGLSFGEMIPLQNQQFSIQVQANGISTVGSYIIYMYFHGMTQV